MAALAVEMRTCTKCAIVKPISEFYLNCYGRNGPCNACVKEKNRLYYERKKADIAVKHAEHRVARAAGAEMIDAGAVERRRATAFEDRYAGRRENVNVNKRERHANDAQFRAIELHSNRLQRAFTHMGGDMRPIVGCSKAWFRKWIEHQWQLGMTWENYGTYWCLDHVVPKDAFDFLDDAQVATCNDWRNFQPLTRAENSHKHTERDVAFEADHEMQALIFELYQEINGHRLDGPRGNNARD